MDDMDDPQGRERLLRARGEIAAIVGRYDLCASVVLSAPGQFEALLCIESSWSRAKLEITEHGQGIRITSKLADYRGDVEAQKKDLEATMSMVRGFMELLGFAAFAFHKVDESLSRELNAVSTPLSVVHKQ